MTDRLNGDVSGVPDVAGTPAVGRLARGCILISPAAAVFRPMKTSETVARDVVHDIVARGLRSGDRLPHEAAMLQQYSVSRESLREGLRLLEVQGLITLRRGPGGGPVVGHIDPANLGRTASLHFHVAGATYEELFDAWIVTERLQAELAADAADREGVRAAMAPFIAHPELDPAIDLANFVQLHSYFHALVAALAGNTVLELLLQTVSQIVTHHVVIQADPRDIHEVIEADHRDIARAISAGYVHKARDCMDAHVRRMSETYRDLLGDQMSDYIEWR